MIALYYRLTKPGIVYSNVLTALAAFAFGAIGTQSVILVLALIVGLAFSIAGAGVLNNVIDRDIDSKMKRTQKRALPSGTISATHALLFGSILCVLGIGLLTLFVSLLAAALTVFAIATYLGFYTPLKRITPHSTLAGALPGALPPVIGYVAAGHSLDLISLVLFLILVTWQMTHFFAIAIYRADDYRAADLPVMPVYTSIIRTQHLMLLYTVAFSISIFLLSTLHTFSHWYLLCMGFLSGAWLMLTLSGYVTRDVRLWARRMFFFSLLTLVAYCLCLSLA